MSYDYFRYHSRAYQYLRSRYGLPRWLSAGIATILITIKWLFIVLLVIVLVAAIFALLQLTLRYLDNVFTQQPFVQLPSY